MKFAEFSKLAEKEYNTRHNWVGKVIFWELCKRLKFDLIIKWYLLKPESDLESETHNIFWDFEILIPARRPGLWLIKKKRIYYLVDHRVKIKESEKINKYLDLARELKKTVEHDDHTNCSWCV